MGAPRTPGPAPPPTLHRLRSNGLSFLLQAGEAGHRVTGLQFSGNRSRNMDLMLYGAVPFNIPDGSIAARRARKTGAHTELTLDQLVMLHIANDAEEAIQFMLGPRHQVRNTSASPSYRNPEITSYRCAPNTPVQTLSFDFAATDGDCSESETSVEDEQDLRSGARSESGRKRRRLVSFSCSAPHTRRVPHKKLNDERCDRKILSCKKLSPAPSSGPDLTDCTTLPRLNFFAEVQKAAGDGAEEATEHTWRSLGKSLRAIADRSSEAVQGNRRRAKEISLEDLPNGVWSAVITYVFWKFIKGLK